MARKTFIFVEDRKGRFLGKVHMTERAFNMQTHQEGFDYQVKQAGPGFLVVTLTRRASTERYWRQRGK